MKNHEFVISEKETIIMKLLHYFITSKGYTPIILYGINNEIWLEKMDAEYRIIRIDSNYIHNQEQFKLDLLKASNILKGIKRKTFSWKLKTLNIYTNKRDEVELEDYNDINSMYIVNEDDFKQYPYVYEEFPDIDKKLVFEEEGFQLFSKITEDINNNNLKTAKKSERLFNNKSTPIVTYTLLAINILLFLLTMYNGNRGEELFNKLTLWPDMIKYGDYYRLITSTFLHGGWIHLLCNCYALYIIGPQIERFFGKIKYLIIYFFSALAASLFSMLITNGISVGASGAVFGLFGAILYFGYYYRAYMGNVINSQIIPLIVLNLAISFINPAIDGAAHIGGLIGGVLISYAVGVKEKSSKTEKVNGIIVSILLIGFLIFMNFFYK